MTWTLVSYSEVKLPVMPYRLDYIIGVIENEEGQRLMAQIDKKHAKELSVGINGGIKSVEGPNGEINLFTPHLKKGKEEKINKVALVTGSSRGIGRAIAIELAKNGADVVINSSKSIEERIGTMNEIKKLGRRTLHVQADVSDPEQVKKMIEKIIKKFGRIDILVNNAGVTMDKKLENMTIDQWNKVISVDLTGVFNCTKSVVKFMQKQGAGKIINISSVVGEMGNIGQSNYSASKGGVISFTKTIAKEYASDGILVNAVAPGFIKTRMLENIPKGVMRKILDQIPLGRLGKPEEVAKLVCFLSSDDVNYITGQVFDINGGIYM